MRCVRAAALVAFAISFALPVLADDEFKLEGSAFLDAEACAKGLNSKDCILTFSVTGKVAEQLYKGMPGQGQREECTGGLEKSGKNGLHCIMYDTDNTYSCEFGYAFKKQSFGAGGMDC
ncbi:MAG: hypothetical protein U1E15_07800 [Hyphomicrobiales bacterium]